MLVSLYSQVKEVILMVPVNYLAILLATIIYMALGFIWYGPLFGKPWRKIKGYDKQSKEEMSEMQKQMMPWYAVTFVVTLITAYLLSHVMVLSQNYFHYAILATGLTTGFFMWLGFSMPVRLYTEIFGEKQWTVFLIDAGYALVGYLLMGAIIGYLA